MLEKYYTLNTTISVISGSVISSVMFSVISSAMLFHKNVEIFLHDLCLEFLPETMKNF